MAELLELGKAIHGPELTTPAMAELAPSYELAGWREHRDSPELHHARRRAPFLSSSSMGSRLALPWRTQALEHRGSGGAWQRRARSQTAEPRLTAKHGRRRARHHDEFKR
ncbi:hypothetical protein Dimus_012953 [Dionaea muscipula]